MPFRLGFLLRRRGVHPYETSRTEYRGVDREPEYPPPDELEKWRHSGEEQIAVLWDDFGAAVYEQRLDASLSLALRFRSRFDRLGIELDLIFAAIEYMPSDYSQYRHASLWKASLSKCLDARLDTHFATANVSMPERFLGFDVSHPVPSFHSAIVQPGLSAVDRRLGKRLNANGLFEEAETAVEMMEKANTMDYGLLPFCVLSVRAVDGGTGAPRETSKADL